MRDPLKTSLLMIGLAAAACATTRTAAVDDDPRALSMDSWKREPPPEMQTAAQPGWYGYQTLLVDGGAALLLGVSTASALGSPSGFRRNDVTYDLALLGTAVYLAGTPTVHLFHRRPAEGFASLALRVFLPLGGALLGAFAGLGIANENCSNIDNCRFEGLTAGFGVGAGLGAIVAMVRDAGVAVEDEPAAARVAVGRNGIAIAMAF